MIDIIKEVVEPLINPSVEAKPLLKKIFKDKASVSGKLREESDVGIAIQELTKTYAWREVIRPKIVKSLREGLGYLLRDGLKMSEVEIKNIISNMRANLELVSELRYLVEKGESAGIKLSELEGKR